VADQAFAVFLFVNSLLLAKLFKVPITKIALVLLPLLLLAGWILLSISWSEFPDLTFRRGAREVVELISLSILGLSFSDDKEFVRMLYWSFLFTIFLNLLILGVLARSFVAGNFGGIWGNKNTLGAFLFYSLPIVGIAIFDRSISTLRILGVFALLCGLGMLALSSSKSAIGCAVIAGCLAGGTRLWSLQNAYSRILVPLLALLAVLSCWVVVADLGLSNALTLAFGDATLTGRDRVWAYALFKYDDHPIQGVGYGALWQIGQQIEDLLRHAGVSWVANQAHDGYIDILAQLGSVGLGLLAVYLLVSFIRLVRFMTRSSNLSFPGIADYAAYIFWGALIYNITESSFFRAGHPLWAIFLLVNAFVGGQVFKRFRRVKDGQLYKARAFPAYGTGQHVVPAVPNLGPILRKPRARRWQ
jgi:O-antigen ligase